MATTIEPEGDPTYLAFERARQWGEMTLQQHAARDTARANEDVAAGQADLQREETQSVDKNSADYRARGFGMSGLRFKAEGQIRADIASRLGELLRAGQRQTTDIGTGLAEDLAQSRFDQAEQQLAARARLTLEHAQSGVGI